MHSGVRVGFRALQKQPAWIERVASKQIGRQNTETGRVSAPSTATLLLRPLPSANILSVCQRFYFGPDFWGKAQN